MNLHRFSVLALVGLGLASPTVHAAGPDASWLPASTVGYLAINDADSFFAAWDATPPGKLFASKPFQSFFKSVWDGQAKDPLTVSWLQGLTLDDLRKTGGGVVLAVVAGEDQPASVVLILDGRGRRDVVDALLRRVTGSLEQRLRR